MRLLIALCLVALAVASPVPEQTQNYNYQPYNGVQILSYENDNIGLGNYFFKYLQSDGQSQEARGQINNEGREDEYNSVVGSFTWVGPDGVTYIVRYTADKNGYQPEIEEGPGGAVSPAVLASLVG